MPDYRLYCLNDTGKIQSADWIFADTDDEAIALARGKKLVIRCELWSGNRRVAQVAPDLEPKIHIDLPRQS
jgi:hypothetical protein